MLFETEPFPRNGVPLVPLILLVEDDPDNAQLFLHILTQETSLRVFWARNGMAALHFTQHVKPQLFLLDYFLPDMNGIALYDQLHVQKELEAVPALIMGAYLEAAGDDIKQRGLLALEKPFELDEFLSIIQSIVAVPSAMRGL
jgi:CheY-like chemotaxis protein